MQQLGPVYFKEEPTKALPTALSELERTHEEGYFLFIDRLDVIAEDLLFLLSRGRLRKARIVACESSAIWKRRVEASLSEFCCAEYRTHQITEQDSAKILRKIEEFGPWTRLSQMTERNRRREILVKSKRQLLIGLLETTSGSGFEQIIENEVGGLADAAKSLLLLVCLCTVHRQGASSTLINRALQNLGQSGSAENTAQELSGIVDPTVA